MSTLFHLVKAKFCLPAKLKHLAESSRFRIEQVRNSVVPIKHSVCNTAYVILRRAASRAHSLIVLSTTYKSLPVLFVPGEVQERLILPRKYAVIGDRKAVRFALFLLHHSEGFY